MLSQPKDVVPLGEFWSEWSRCITFQYQRDMLYRFGKFDDCGAQWQDYKVAMRAKFTRDADQAAQLLDGTHYYRTKHVSPTIGVIWEPKGKPSWDAA